MNKKMVLICSLLLFSSCTIQNRTSNQDLPQSSPSSQKSLNSVQQTEQFLEQLSSDLALGFSDPGPLDFTWKVAGEKTGKIRNIEKFQINGMAIALTETPKIEEKTNTPIETVVANYLKNQGFKKDLYNNNAGTVAGTQAYTKDTMHCLINWEIIGGIEGYKTAKIPMNVALICGVLGE